MQYILQIQTVTAKTPGIPHSWTQEWSLLKQDQLLSL